MFLLGFSGLFNPFSILWFAWIRLMDNFSIFLVNSSISSLSCFFLGFSSISSLRKFSLLSTLLAILNACSISSGSFSCNFCAIDNFNAYLYIGKIIPFTIEEVPTFLSNIEEIPSKSENFKEERVICLGEHLTKDEITKINKLLNKYNKVLASNSSELTCANVLPHEIDTGDSKPVKGVLYQSPSVFDEFVKKEIDNLLRDGLIKELKSP